MKQKRAGYSLEFKLQAIQLVKEGGQPLAEVARSLGVPKSTLFDWVTQHEKEHEEQAGSRSRANGAVLRLKRELEQVKKERDFLKKACLGLLRPGRQQAFALVDAEKADYSVQMMCSALGVSRSGYYARSSRRPSVRELQDKRLVTHIKAVHERSRRTYGSPRVFLDLVAQGFQVGLNRVARLMRQHGIFSVRKRRRRRTTNSNHDLKVSSNLVQRQFDVKEPNRVWAADLTYIWTTAGWLYLAVVMDLFSRRIVGWAMDNHMRTDLAADALKMAISSRQDTHGTIHHSDRGSQYASHDYQGLLREHGLICSMSRKGDCWDNAVVESFFATLKSELVFHRSWNTRRDAIGEIFEYVEVFYNRRRRHSTVGGLSPVDYENAFACTKRAA